MILYIIYALILGLLLGVLLFYYINRRLRNPQNAIEPEAAKFSNEAERILLRAGFKILDKNKSAPILTIINGKSHLGKVTADFMVEKDKKIYAVHLRSDLAVDLTEPANRQKLIEQDYVFQPDGLLLLDLNQKQLHEVYFEVPKPERENFFTLFIALFIILVIIGIIWLLLQLRLF